MRVALASLLSVVSMAAAQKPLLDLSAAPSAPAAGSGAGTLALADQMANEAKSIAAEKSPSSRVRAELRRLVRQMLIAGENAGGAGSARVVLGRTLAASLATLDAMAIDAAPPILAMAEQDLMAAHREFESGNPDPDRVLRDGLATLARSAAVPNVGGWVDEAPAALAGEMKVEAWSRLPGITAEASAALREVETLTAAMEEAGAFKASGLRIRAIVCEAFTTLEKAPSWIVEPSRRLMGGEVSKAMTQLLSAESRNAAIEALSRAARMAEVVRRADLLEDSVSARRIRAAVDRAFATTAVQADARTFESFKRLLELVTDSYGWPEDRALVRQLRPGYKALASAARQNEVTVLGVLPEVLRRPEAMTDPGTISAVNSLRKAVDDVRGLLAVNDAIKTPADPAAEPSVAPGQQKVAERLLKLSQDLNKADQKELAITSLRALMAHVRAHWKLPGEDELRKAAREDVGKPPAERTSVWAKLSGGREAALVSEITDRRAGWMNSWERGPVLSSDGERLAALRMLMDVMKDAAPIFAVGSEDGYRPLQQWPGWELSWGSVSALSAGLPTELSEAARVLLSGDHGKATELVVKARRDYAVTLLAGRLASEAKARGIAGSFSLVQLTSGGPIRGRSWMGQWTEELDDVCRYSEESLAVRKLGAKDKADAMIAFANLRAVAVLDGMNAR